MSHYRFVTHWSLNAPVEAVWRAIVQPLEWPQWWRGVQQVIQIEPGGEEGLGGVHRSTWRSILPYRLTFDSRAVQVDRLHRYEIEASGQLQGRGVWTFTSAGNITHLRYDWNVEATKWWMRLLSPLARPLFRWNHDVIMNWGEAGLAQRLEDRGADAAWS